jgi:glycerol-3-phosphate acyltransferase PlsY
MDGRIAIEALVSFLIGSIPFAILAMAGSGIDIRTVGSGNPGFNNVLRVDKKRAIFTLAGDLGKGYLPLWIFYQPDLDPYFHGWLLGFAAVFGHCYSPWLKFNGGKGVATSAGVMLRLFPLWAAGGLTFFVLLRLLGSRRRWREAGAIASVSTWAFFSIVLYLNEGFFDGRNAALMTAFLTWRHQSNIRKLFA